MAENNRFPFKMYSRQGDGRLVNSTVHRSSMEIIEVLRGAVEIQIGTEMLAAEAGDFVFVPTSNVFRIVASGGVAAVRAIVFDSAIIRDNMENFDEEVFYMFDVQSRNKISVFKEGHPVYPTLSHYMSESYEEDVAKDICYKLPIRANIYLMMTALLRYYCGTKDDSDRMIYHNVLRLAPVISYIGEHFCEKLYVEELADMINVSADYFTKMFKDSIGKTPIEYINGLRVNRAMELLYKTKDSMAEIAEGIGFCNPNYFHKIFKQYMGVSPLAYRKGTL
ncbi:MAG: helix-turn-helix transcriptional regulator [Clostridia bacterium]|nr:helix-turn-helix transcriptional regulator [Clostridia bacterium]